MLLCEVAQYLTAENENFNFTQFIKLDSFDFQIEFEFIITSQNIFVNELSEVTDMCETKQYKDSSCQIFNILHYLLDLFPCFYFQNCLAFPFNKASSPDETCPKRKSASLPDAGIGAWK